MRNLPLLYVSTLGLLGCASRELAEHVVHLSPPATSVVADPGQSPEGLSVALVAKPDALELDGQLEEWGSLLPSETQELPDLGEPKVSAVRIAEVPAPNPASAASHVALAVTPQAAWLAAELRGSSQEGIWFGFGAIAPDLPAIGELVVRGGSILPFNCEHEVILLEGDRAGESELGPPRAPEVARACREVVARQEAFNATFRARFERVLRLTPTSVEEQLADGSIKPVAGARVQASRNGDVTTLEVTLPLSAYPRLVEAPWEWARIAATPLGAGTKAALSDHWVPLRLPEPVAFEPEANLRAQALGMGYGLAFYPPAISYSPATPLLIESLRRDGPSAIESVEKPLYRRLGSLGTREIGVSEVFAQSLVFRDPETLFLVPQTDGSYVEWTERPEIHGVFQRGDLLLAILSTNQIPHSNGYAGPQPAEWTVLESMPGNVGVITFEEAYVPIFDGPAEFFHNADFTELGIRGRTHWPKSMLEYEEKGVRREISWRWNAAEKSYRLKGAKRGR